MTDAAPLRDFAAERRREMLVEFALYLSPTWERDNEDDRESAEYVVDAFLDQTTWEEDLAS